MLLGIYGGVHSAIRSANSLEERNTYGGQQNTRNEAESLPDYALTKYQTTNSSRDHRLWAWKLIDHSLLGTPTTAVI
jgi:hypothetical protein